MIKPKPITHNFAYEQCTGAPCLMPLMVDRSQIDRPYPDFKNEMLHVPLNLFIPAHGSGDLRILEGIIKIEVAEMVKRLNERMLS